MTGSALFPSDETDEVYNSSDGSRRSSGSEATADFGGLKYRRSADLATTSACVSKNIRIRKRKGKRSGAEASRQLATTAVHLKIHPRPANISESRQILRVLQRFGDVVMFKNLRYEPLVPAPSTSLAMYREAESAKNLLRASPLVFTLEPVEGGGAALEREPEASQEEPPEAASEGSGAAASTTTAIPPTGPISMASGQGKWGNFHSLPPQTRRLSTTHSPQYRVLSAQPPPPPSLQSSPPTPKLALPSSPPLESVAREFHVSVTSSTMNHADYISRERFHGPFQIDTKSAIQEDLAKRVPLNMLGISDIGIMHPSLNPNKPERIVSKQRVKDRTRKSLRRLWEEALEEGIGDGIGDGRDM
ncbi:hypothetical protein B0A49_00610 [Cryomyces minteri]|uniref:RRM domain-containing protein n=1 Tax=Cryomyces minteri TaxID=331657 RepID=A0A4U0XYE4_9PEZI|nr:hypothetical protein B0A49_00610 [Cryomyces minteri]